MDTSPDPEQVPAGTPVGSVGLGSAGLCRVPGRVTVPGPGRVALSKIDQTRPSRLLVLARTCPPTARGGPKPNWLFTLLYSRYIQLQIK